MGKKINMCSSTPRMWTFNSWRYFRFPRGVSSVFLAKALTSLDRYLNIVKKSSFEWDLLKMYIFYIYICITNKSKEK